MHREPSPAPPDAPDPAKASARQAAPVAPGSPSQRRLGILLVLLSGTCFGATPIFVRFASADGASPSTVLFIRFALAGLVMLALMAVRRAPVPRGRDLWALWALGGVIYVGQSLTYFWALLSASASIVSIVVYVYPALVTIMSAVFLKEHVSRGKMLAVGMSLLGCALTVGQVRGGHPIGILLAFASALVYALYVVLANRVAVRAGAVSVTTVILVSAAISYGAMLLVQGPHWPHTLFCWSAAVGLSLVSTVTAALAFMAGLRRIGPVTASTLATVEPIITVVLAMLLLGESIGPLQMAGGALVIGAVLLIARK